MTPTRLLADSHGRIIRDLRISLTDRCNFRCLYCLPETEAASEFYRGRWADKTRPSPLIAHRWQPRENFLTFEEITRVARIVLGLGIQKLRLTGGEPLLRRQVDQLVSMLSPLPGLEDLAMTTNGFHFRDQGPALQRAGLKRVSFSLDSLDRENFRHITGRDGLEEVLTSIELAKSLGLHPVKVNAVIIRGINDHELEALAEFARERDLSLRFIEFMPLDSGRVWLKDLVVTGREILQRLQSAHKLIPRQSERKSETARRWSFPDGRGEIGIIAPVSEPFCGHCDRLRLTADGKIRTCLFSLKEHDLRSLLRGGATDEQIEDWLRAVVLGKEPRHYIGEPGFQQPERPMSCIGG